MSAVANSSAIKHDVHVELLLSSGSVYNSRHLCEMLWDAHKKCYNSMRLP